MEIEILNVSKWYGSKPVLKDINLTLTKGITGLLGPNGAGKTTLISIIAGLLKPSSGKVIIEGKNPFYNPPIRKEIGLLPENSSIPKNLTVDQFMAWQRLLTDTTKVEADRVLNIVGMEKYRKKKIKNLSKGMLGRIKFATALLGDPNILLLDEPFNGIDPGGRKLLRDYLLYIANKKTIIFSSHILEEVEMIANNIVVLKTGFIIAEGTPEGIRQLLTDVPYKVYINCSDPITLLKLLFDHRLIQMGKIEGEDGIIVETFSYSKLAHLIPQIAIKQNITIHRFIPEDMKLDKLFEYLTVGSDVI